MITSPHGLTRNPACGAVAGADNPDSVGIERATSCVRSADSAQQLDDYVRQRFRSPAYHDDAVLEAQIQQKLCGLGIDGHVRVTGYDRPARGRRVTEIQIQRLDPQAMARVDSEPLLQQVLCRLFGRGAAWAGLHRTYDAAARELVVGVDAPVELVNPPALPIPADHVTHHNQSLDAWSEAHRRGLIGRGNVLVHVDTHSDLYVDTTPGHSIADYVNRALAHGVVGEVYWVVPDDLPATSTSRTYGPLNLTAVPPYDTTVRVLDAVAARQAEASIDALPTRDVTVHVVRRRDLPLAALAGRDNVLLDVDLDYFSNSGRDSAAGSGHNRSRAHLHAALNDFAAFCHQLRPAFATLCLSPEYTPPDDQALLRGFFRQLFPCDLIANRATAYAHGHAPSLDEAVLSLLKDSIAAPGRRQLSRELYDELVARGHDEVAAAYARYCRGAITEPTLRRYANRAIAALADVVV